MHDRSTNDLGENECQESDAEYSQNIISISSEETTVFNTDEVHAEEMILQHVQSIRETMLTLQQDKNFKDSKSTKALLTQLESLNTYIETNGCEEHHEKIRELIDDAYHSINTCTLKFNSQCHILRFFTCQADHVGWDIYHLAFDQMLQSIRHLIANVRPSIG